MNSEDIFPFPYKVILAFKIEEDSSIPTESFISKSYFFLFTKQKL